MPSAPSSSTSRVRSLRTMRSRQSTSSMPTISARACAMASRKNQSTSCRAAALRSSAKRRLRGARCFTTSSVMTPSRCTDSSSISANIMLSGSPPTSSASLRAAALSITRSVDTRPLFAHHSRTVSTKPNCSSSVEMACSTLNSRRTSAAVRNERRKSGRYCLREAMKNRTRRWRTPSSTATRLREIGPSRPATGSSPDSNVRSSWSMKTTISVKSGCRRTSSCSASRRNAPSSPLICATSAWVAGPKVSWTAVSVSSLTR